MATPSYMTIISGIVTRLKNDNRLDVFRDDNIFFGNEPQIADFPAITVEMTEAIDIWKSFPNNKDMSARILITVIERNMKGYADGLQAVEHYTRIIDDVFHTDTKISGTCYDSKVGSRKFGPGFLESVPVFVCEMELQTVTRYNSKQ